MTVTTSASRVAPRPPYQLRSRRRLAAVPLSFAWALTPFVYAALVPGPLALAVVVVVALFTAAGGACLLRPPSMVRLDDDGLVFDSRPLGWAEVDHLELRQTFMGLRLRARGGGGAKPPRVFQVLLAAPMPEVLAEAHARAASPVTLVELPPTRAERYRRPAWAALFLATVASFVSFVPVPGATFSGPRDALPVGSRLQGATARPGTFFILAVSEGTVSPLRLLRAALDNAMDVTWHSPAFSRRLLSDPRGRDHRALSEAGARAAASGCVGQPVAASGGEVTITGFRPLVPGTGLLEPGDRLLSADGRPVRYVEDLFAAAALHRVGEQLVLQARSPDGTTHTAAVPILVNEGTPIPKGIGLNTAPLQLAPSSFIAGVDLAGLSGSSAGLVSALGLVDALGPGPLADGRRIAVTGTIAPDGRVGPIAGLRYKAAAAQRAGATLMLVPSTQVDVARRYAGKLTVMGVDSLDQAVRALGGSGCRPL